MAWSHTTASVVLEGSGFWNSERTRSAKDKLERHTVNKDLQKLGLTWEQAKVAAPDNKSVVQCAHKRAKST